MRNILLFFEKFKIGPESPIAEMRVERLVGGGPFDSV
jgi:hypothetical protein